MSAPTTDFSRIFRVQSEQSNDVHRYALVDSAQNPELTSMLGEPGACLFGSRPGTPIARVSPHLVRLPRQQETKAWKCVARHAPRLPCLTVVTSRLPFDALYQHFKSHLEVRIGKNTMHLAYWDPAILAVLVGQQDDDTLFVQGPVFDQDQLASFLSPVIDWWYWDRRQTLRRIRPEQGKAVDADAAVSVLPLEFRPAQTDLLVQASLPDRVLYELRVNQPHLLETRDEWQNYDLACRLLNSAKDLRIHGLQDQVNFVGTGMILGEEFHLHPDVHPYLQGVPSGSQRFVEALRQVPTEALEAARSQGVRQDGALPS